MTLATQPGVADAALLRRLYDGKLLPDQLIDVFRRGETLFPTRIVSRGAGPVRPLAAADKRIEDLAFESGGRAVDLNDYVSRNRVVGLLVLKAGRVALEYYGAGVTERTSWMSMSMAKSVATTLVGAAIHEGLIGGLDDRVSDYVAPLRQGAYAATTVRDLIQMTSGADWNEAYEDAGSDRRRMLDLQIGQQPGEILRYVGGRAMAAEPGQRWNYSTGETHVVGALLKAATGRFLADYLSETLWSRLGMEADAAWWLESPGGLEVAGSGLNATLRDYGRFGLFVMGGGVIDGRRILPEGWVEAAGAARDVGGERVDYGFMWWPVPAPAGAPWPDGFRASGIFGQYIYVNPAEQVVVVVWSARSKPKGAEAIPDNDLFNAVAEALR